MIETPQIQPAPAGIHAAMAAIMADVEAIGKTRKNQSQGFIYRGIDDVYNDLHPVFARHGVFILPQIERREMTERTSVKGGVLFSVVVFARFRFVHADGSFVEAATVGEAMDSGDKATNKAMSIALKYALFQSFLIPTEADNDPDASAPEVAPLAKAQPVAPAPAARAKPVAPVPAKAKEPAGGNPNADAMLAHAPTEGWVEVTVPFKKSERFGRTLLDLAVNEPNELHSLHAYVAKRAADPDNKWSDKDQALMEAAAEGLAWRAEVLRELGVASAAPAAPARAKSQAPVDVLPDDDVPF